jgi:hypothetical protein
VSPLGAVLTLAEDLAALLANAGSEDLWPGMRRTAACLKAGITLDRFEDLHLRLSSPIPSPVRARG